MAVIDRRYARLLVTAVLASALAGCATYPGSYPGGYGGDPYGSPDRDYGMQGVEGTVEAFDLSSGRLLLVSGGAYGRYGSTFEVWVDRGTRLYYQGREQDVAGLERGDMVRIDVADDGRRLWARSIEVTRNVRDGGYPGYPGEAAGFEAAVRYVDTRRRLIEVTRGGYAGRVEQVGYDARTRFEYRGQAVDPSQLEAGDIVRIDARPSGSGWLATYVVVTVDARSR
jgi:hypothetical protein